MRSSFELRSLSRLSWATLFFLLIVVGWGSFVRASGSGAGCGNHWPLCNGVVIPVGVGFKTYVEFGHRVSSGIGLILCGAMCFLSFKCAPRGSFVRKAATASFGFGLAEGAIGAGLVLLRLVEKDESYLRAIYLAFHLMNTFFLVGAVGLTARWAEIGGEKFRLSFRQLGKPFFWSSLFSVLLVLGLGASGAVTALGDTLYPVSSIQAGFLQDISPTKNFLIELRIYHPLIAVVVSLYLILFARFVLKFKKFDSRLKFHAWAVLILQLGQLCLGVLNIYLLAPVAIQLAHLWVADLIWINLILLLSSIWVQRDELTIDNRV